MKETNIKIIIQIEKPDGKTREISLQDTITEEKWNKIIEIDNRCQARKNDIITLLGTHLTEYFETLTPEKAEEIVTSWDF